MFEHEIFEKKVIFTTYALLCVYSMPWVMQCKDLGSAAARQPRVSLAQGIVKL